ncbi:DHH family phosphoesterase, partial [Lachnospiraceae bacterium OttesenSCG-928-E19]|nr:DHH family phosphoesterase [Lachnospiraceae bacterium OttesenSCG-928-E19]
MQDKINQLTEKIKSANSIAILMHINPDGDAVGSGIGLREIIRDNFGKDSTLIYPGKYEFVLDFLPGTSDMIHIDDYTNHESFDLVISVDTGSTSLITDLMDIFNNAKATIKIDHHVQT